MERVGHGGVAASRERTARERDVLRLLRVYLLLGCVLVGSLLALTDLQAASRVPAIWPAAGLVAGLHLIAPRRWRWGLLGISFALMLLAHLATHFSLVRSVGFSAATVLAALVVRPLLVRGLEGRHAALVDQGDVSRMIGAIGTGSAVAGLVCGGTVALSGSGSPGLAALAAFGGHAAAMMVLLPLFLRAPRFAPVAGVRERVVQGALTLGTTYVVFAFADAPPVMFAVMPMFAWHAFRGTLREATLLLTVVGAIGTGFTVAEIGPVWAMGQRYGLAPELTSGVLQLFLLDCGLILLPLSVMSTQQRMSAASAAAEREKLERLVALATGTAVMATGADGRVVIFNPGAEAMLGYTAEEVIGQLPDMFLADSELQRHASGLGARPTFEDICRASVAAGDANRLWWFERPGGERRSMRMTLTAVPDERGLTTGYLATAEDVTEREAAHQSLLLTLEHERTALDRIQELERVKGDFVSTVSHELRTPITSIVGYTEVLQDGMLGELTPEQKQIVDRVDRNGRRLLALVEDLLTLSQIESSHLKIDPVSTDLRRVVEEAHRSMGEELAGRDLRVEVVIPARPHVLEGDPVQLQRMVRHLLANAVKFTPDGGSITVDLRESTECVELVVRDTGIGIPEAEQERMFTRFFRSTTAYDQAIQGTGLGLTIVRAIIALHGGQLSVESTEEQGTTVVVVLPRAALVISA